MEPFVTSGGRNPVNDALRRMDWRSRSIVVGMIEDANSALETNATANLEDLFLYEVEGPDDEPAGDHVFRLYCMRADCDQPPSVIRALVLEQKPRRPWPPHDFKLAKERRDDWCRRSGKV